MSSGAEAVRAAGATTWLAVLMDCHMPDMDGFEATRLIHALPAPFGEVTVIALTASTSEVDLAACRSCGMAAVLTKPASLADIKRVLGPLRSGMIAKTTPLG